MIQGKREGDDYLSGNWDVNNTVVVANQEYVLWFEVGVNKLRVM
jgi:hypothetical protein